MKTLLALLLLIPSLSWGSKIGSNELCDQIMFLMSLKLSPLEERYEKLLNLELDKKGYEELEEIEKSLELVSTLYHNLCIDHD